MEMMSASIGNLALALSKFQGSVGLIPKSKTANVPTKSGGSYKYSYADLADIWERIGPELQKVELAITQMFVMEGTLTYLQTMLMHSSGEWIKSILEVGDHEKIQELGSEITYLRRYGLSSLTGLAADEDEDGALANGAAKGADASKAEKPVAPAIKPISQKQIDWMEGLLRQLADDEFEMLLCEKYNVRKLTEIYNTYFNEVKDALEKEIASRRGKANAKSA